MSNTEFTFAIQEKMRSARNYNMWIADQFLMYVGERMLDIGSGYGNVIQYFLSNTRDITSLDVEPEYAQYLNTTLGSRQYRAYAGDFLGVTEADHYGAYDTVSCFNVLEHLPDDVSALKKMFALLGERGIVMLFVPALPVLFGAMDRADGHFRRYTKRSLREAVVLANPNASIVHMYYMNSVGAFGWFVSGRMLKKSQASPAQVRFFDYIVPLLRFCEHIIHPPFGQSLVCIVKKT